MDVIVNAELIVQTADGPMLWAITQQDTFMGELEEAYRYNDFTDGEVVDKVLEVITIVMTTRFRYPYAKSFFRYHFKRLRRRFALFKYVLEFPWVLWDRESNLMEMSIRTKSAMSFDNPRSELYHEHGEPLWDKLQFFFDKPDMWLDDPRLIIPTADDGLFRIPPTFQVCDDPLYARIRERKFKKIYNGRWSIEGYI